MWCGPFRLAHDLGTRFVLQHERFRRGDVSFGRDLQRVASGGLEYGISECEGDEPLADIGERHRGVTRHGQDHVVLWVEHFDHQLAALVWVTDDLNGNNELRLTEGKVCRPDVVEHPCHRRSAVVILIGAVTREDVGNFCHWWLPSGSREGAEPRGWQQYGSRVSRAQADRIVDGDLLERLEPQTGFP